MPKFVYYRAHNHKGYGSSIHWYTQTDAKGQDVTDTGTHYFQKHEITDQEAGMGIKWLEKKYPAVLPKEE